MDKRVLARQLIEHEGWRKFPYVDSVGKLSIGCGRNLTDVGLSQDEVEMLLDHDIEKHLALLDRDLPWWRGLDEVRQLVMADLCFNLGIGGLLTFKNTLRLIKAGSYREAAENMLLSKWARQVGRRARRLSRMMATGEMVTLQEVA